jgi:hypothetical protein
MKQSEKEKCLKIIYKAWCGLDEFKSKKYNDLPITLWETAGLFGTQDYDWSFLRDANDSDIKSMYEVCLIALSPKTNKKTSR